MSEILTHDTRIFSQDGNLSQMLVGGFSQQKDSSNNEEQDDSGRGSEDKALQEGILSSQAQVICEENRQINRFLETSLKTIENKRLWLISKKDSINQLIQNYGRLHERQSQLSIEAQMNHEEWTGKYQNELNERHKVEEKVSQTVKFFNIYEQYYDKAKDIAKNIENNMQIYDSTSSGPVLKKSKDLQMKYHDVKSNFMSDMGMIIAACKDCKEDIMKERENFNTVCKPLYLEILKICNKIREAEYEKVKLEQKQAELDEKACEVLTEKEVMSMRINEHYEELNSLKTYNASVIQDLKVRINTEENENKNLEKMLEEKENTYSGLEKKFRELKNSLIQVENSIEESKKHVSEQADEINTYNNKISILKKRECFLRENIKQNENLGTESHNFSKEIRRLDEEVKLNFDILSEKRELIYDKEMERNNFKEVLNNLQSNVSDLERDLYNCKSNENEVISKVKESRLHHEQEREKKISHIKTLEKMNVDLASDIEKATSEIEQLHLLNDIMNHKKEEITVSIAQYNNNSRINEKKLVNMEEEWEKEVALFEEETELKSAELEEYEDLIIEAKPLQEQLSETISVKNSLEKEIILLSNTYQDKIETLENNNKLKIQELDCERENYISIMENLLKNKEKETDVVKDEIKEKEKLVMKIEEDLKIMFQKLKDTKNKEAMKRIKIVKMNKRIDMITKEVRITQNDIVDAVTGNIEEPVTDRKNKMMPPPSSVSSYNQYGKHMKTGSIQKTPEFSPKIAESTSKQEYTRKWIESVPADEMEYSEV